MGQAMSVLVFEDALDRAFNPRLVTGIFIWLKRPRRQ